MYPSCVQGLTKWGIFRSLNRIRTKTVNQILLDGIDSIEFTALPHNRELNRQSFNFASIDKGVQGCIT